MNAQAPGKAMWVLAGLVALLGWAGCGPEKPRVVQMHLDPSIEHQVFAGFEVTAQAGQFESPVYDTYRDELFARAVAEFGLSRVRLEVLSGAEHSRDRFGEFLAGRATMKDWLPHRYAVVNDNADPQARNGAGFQFSGLDATVRRFIEPLRAARRADPVLADRPLHVNLCYVAFDGGADVHRKQPEEYAEFVLATFEHLKATFDLVPDDLEIILEPDVGGWSPQEVAAVIPPAVRRLRESGFEPQIIAPSTTDMTKALAYFDAIEANPAALREVDVLSYHRYWGVSEDSLRAIAARAKAAGKRTAMLEHIGSGPEHLLDDVLLGGASAWQQFTLAFPTKDDGAQLYVVLQEGERGTLTLSQIGRRLLPFAWALQAGNRRLELTTSDGAVRGLAVREAVGLRIVLFSENPASITIGGLPQGSYSKLEVNTAGQMVPVAPPAEPSSGVLRVDLTAGVPLTLLTSR